MQIAALKQDGKQPAKRVVGRPFAKGMNGRELFKLRTAAIFEALKPDFANLSSGEQVQLRTAASLIARAERASCLADEAVRCSATANRIISSIRRHAAPARLAGRTLGDLMIEAANTPAEYESDHDEVGGHASYDSPAAQSSPLAAPNVLGASNATDDEERTSEALIESADDEGDE
jgi:hypothetical protein